MGPRLARARITLDREMRADQTTDIDQQLAFNLQHGFQGQLGPRLTPLPSSPQPQSSHGVS